MEEIWRDIPGYEGLYQVSDQGRVKSFVLRLPHEEVILKASRVSLVSREGGRRVHTIGHVVLMAFRPIAGDLNDYCAAHIDSMTDHRLENLIWVTRKECGLRGGRRGGASPKMQTRIRGGTHPSAKLNEDSVRAIRVHAAVGVKRALLEQRYGVTSATIGRVIRRETWKHVL